jgi:predicted nucleic acid-binding protein
MILLLDTDVLIDVALDRNPYSEAAGNLLDWLEQHSGTAYVAWHSIANFYYLVRPVKGHGDTKDFIAELIKFVTVAPTTTEGIATATTLAMKDFEDAMQVAAGLTCRADVIVTRNTRDYSNAPIRAILPADVLKQLSTGD